MWGRFGAGLGLGSCHVFTHMRAQSCLFLECVCWYLSVCCCLPAVVCTAFTYSGLCSGHCDVLYLSVCLYGMSQGWVYDLPALSSAIPDPWVRGDDVRVSVAPCLPTLPDSLAVLFPSLFYSLTHTLWNINKHKGASDTRSQWPNMFAVLKNLGCGMFLAWWLWVYFRVFFGFTLVELLWCEKHAVVGHILNDEHFLTQHRWPVKRHLPPKSVFRTRGQS